MRQEPFSYWSQAQGQTQHLPLLDKPGFDTTNLVAALSLTDSKRGEVTESEATYYNPCIRAQRLSDGALKSFPANGLAAALTAWANEEVVAYSNALNGAIGNMTAINAATSAAGAGSWQIGTTFTSANYIATRLVRNGAVSATGLSLLIEFEYKTSSAYASRVGFDDAGGGELYTVAAIADGEWHTVSATVTNTGTSIGIVCSSTDGTEALYEFRNFSITQLTHSLAVPSGYDASGNGNDFTQAASDAQPLIVENGVPITDANGNLALKFDGVDDFLEAALAIASQPCTIIAVCDPAAATEGGVVMAALNTSTYQGIRFKSTNGSAMSRDGTTLEALAVSGDTGTQLVTFVVRGASDRELLINGSSLDANTATLTDWTSNALYIGKMRSSGLFGGGNITAGFVWGAALTAPQLAAAHAAIAAEYGITLS